MNDQATFNDYSAPRQRRETPRVPVNLSLKLVTKSADGTPLYVRVKAIEISSSGATLVTDSQVVLGRRLRIVTPFGNVVEAEVNWAWADESTGRQHLSVRLTEPGGWFAI